jgi:hypothetical protein
MADADFRWVATLSNGTTFVEHTGDYRIIPGERKPWVRLCAFLAENDLHLTALRLEFKGRTIHLPQSDFDRFSLNARSKSPLYYSLQYHLEGTIDGSGQFSQGNFVDLAAHYEDYAVHFIQDVTNDYDSWVVVTDPEALAPTPIAAVLEGVAS